MQRTLQRISGEFLRYTLVGGIAFVVDFGLMTALQELIFRSAWGVYPAAAAGFLAGIAVNFFGSVRFVFAGKTARFAHAGTGVAGFCIIGLIGLAITQGLLFVGTGVLSLSYIPVKLFATAVVFLWNFFARRLLFA